MAKTKKVSRPAQGDNTNSGKTPRIYAGGDNVRTSGSPVPQANNNKPRRVQ